LTPSFKESLLIQRHNIQETRHLRYYKVNTQSFYFIWAFVTDGQMDVKW